MIKVRTQNRSGTRAAVYRRSGAVGRVSDPAHLTLARTWHAQESKPGKKGSAMSKLTCVLATLALLALPMVAEAGDPAVAREDLARLRLAVGELGRSFPGAYPAADFLRRLAAVDTADELARCRREMLVTANPLLKCRQLLFVKRNAYGSYHYYDEHDNGIIRAGMGGNLCVLSLDDGAVRELAPQLAGGLFDRCDLSFDGRRIVFGYCRAADDALRLWQINVDGSGLRQVTFPPPGETASARSALGPDWRKPAGPAAKDPQGNLSSRRFQTQDFHPCWLPDGGIAFTSTRAQQTVLCGDIGLSVPNLHRVEADGSGLRRLSHGTLNELCPSVLHDGRILYNRWEYVFKSVFLVQPLWALFPDGSRSEEMYGLNIGAPGVFTHGRAVPGRDDLIVCTGACHEQMAVGPILLVDLHADKRSAAAMHSLTPEVEARGNHHRWFLRGGKMVQDDGKGGPVFCDPWPLSDKFFLVAHNPDKPIADKAGYGLYLIDVFGNRVPIYKDPAISCWQPMPLQPRTRPPVLPSTLVRADDSPESLKEGTLFLQNVYAGLDGVRPGSVKYLRVLEQVPRSWEVLQQAAPEDGGCGSPVAVLNRNTHIWVTVLHGIVPVSADGSAYFTVPAERNLFLQALDENYMQVQTMRTFVNLQPGERRSCIGCHEDRRHSPAARNSPALALARPPVRPAAQPGDVAADKPVHYPADVQPVLDRNCVRCHSGATPAGKLNLTAEPTKFFTRSYEELLARGCVQGFSEWTSDPKDAAPLPPYAHGSHPSKLVQMLCKGHHDVKLSRPDFVRLVTWVDLNLPYYGSYFGRRNLRYQDGPDFRPVPTLESVLGLAPATVQKREDISRIRSGR